MVKTIDSIVREYIISHGADGLATHDCGCDKDDLAPCVDRNVLDCVTAVKTECGDCDNTKNCGTTNKSCYFKSSYSKSVVDIIRNYTTDGSVKNHFLGCSCNVACIGACNHMDMYYCWIYNTGG